VTHLSRRPLVDSTPPQPYTGKRRRARRRPPLIYHTTSAKRAEGSFMGVHLIDSALFGDQFGTEPMRQVFDDRAVLRAPGSTHKRPLQVLRRPWA